MSDVRSNVQHRRKTHQGHGKLGRLGEEGGCEGVGLMH